MAHADDVQLKDRDTTAQPDPYPQGDGAADYALRCRLCPSGPSKIRLPLDNTPIAVLCGACGKHSLYQAQEEVLWDDFEVWQQSSIAPSFGAGLSELVRAGEAGENNRMEAIIDSILGLGNSILDKADALDMVNHPPHYTQHPSGVECIEIVEHMPYNIGAATKYLWRCGLKGDEIEDLRKAAWYVNREIERREGQGRVRKEA